MENLVLMHPLKGKNEMEKELIRGRDVANQVLELLALKSNNLLCGDSDDINGNGSKSMLPFAKDLVREVLKSLTNTLLLLNNGDSNHVAAPPPITVGGVSLPMKNCSKPEDLDSTCKSVNTKDRRGRSYKRKSTAPTWEKNSSILIEDGHAWRKYGQKKIMNAKHLRSYYRCTHMSDQHCPAMKHVQRIQEDPTLYRTTYYGHHTCKSSFDSDVNLESDFSFDSSILLNFNNNISSKKECQISPPFLASTKKEPMEVFHDDRFAQNQAFSSENRLLCDFEVYFNYLGHTAMLSSIESIEFENAYEQFGFL